MALYGHEIDASISPLEADLGWIVKLDKGEFVGRDALLKQKESGIRRKLIGFEMRGRGIGRDGYEVFLDGAPAGWVTSGGALADLEQEHRNVLPSDRASGSRNQHSNHDPQPASGCGDGGNSVLQTSEINHVSRKLPVHEGTRVGARGWRRRHRRHHRPRAGGTGRHRLRRPAQGGKHESRQGKSLGSVETVKAVSDIYSPVSGEVIEINASLADAPEKLNADPHGDAWLVKIRLSAARGSSESDVRRRLSNLHRSRKVVALSSEIRIRAPRDAGRLRRQFA